MTGTTEIIPPAIESTVEPTTTTAVETRARPWARFAAAFIAGLLGFLLVGVAAMYAYDASYDGRVLPGVRVGSVDVSGLDRAQAAAALSAAYRGYAQGSIVIHSAAGDRTISFGEIGRRADVDAMIDAAMAVGRGGDPVARGVAEVRNVLRGASVQPRVTLDAAALRANVDEALASLELQPVDATIAMDKKGVITTPARSGRAFDHAALQAAALRIASALDAPATIDLQASETDIVPATTDAEVLAAKAAAERIIADVTLADGSEKWTIPAATVRAWVAFAPTPDGSIAPQVDTAALTSSVAALAKKVERAPVNATFLVSKTGTIVGVTASRDGRSLDVPGTVAAVSKALQDRAGGASPAAIPAALLTTTPKLTSAQAAKAAPLMVRLGTWTTYFPILDRNAYGANIWLPAMYINGTVLAPGQTFDWWKVVGPVTAARGYGMGGFIAGDHTEPTGALGGGMCSSSTTLFNAALRAGLQMGARANHTYYINRYPLGLDATVWISGRARQTVTFTNDTANPILIRGYKIRNGGRGYVRYDIYGVPDGRTVSLSTPIVRNVLHATTKIVYVTTLPHGVRKQTEYPVNGMDVWVTRVVRDRGGNIIHKETYYSHYTLWNGRIEIGV